MRMESQGDYNSRNIEEKKGLTERQKLYVEAYQRLGSARQVAVEMGVSVGTAQDQLLNAAVRTGYKTAKEFATENTPRTSRTSEGKASAESLLTLIESQEYRCELSGVRLEPSSASLDHKTPVSSGGSDEIDNLQWVSTEVNRAKGSMSQDAFIAMCKRVAAWKS